MFLEYTFSSNLSALLLSIHFISLVCYKVYKRPHFLFYIIKDISNASCSILCLTLKLPYLLLRKLYQIIMMFNHNQNYHSRLHLLDNQNHYSIQVYYPPQIVNVCALSLLVSFFLISLFSDLLFPFFLFFNGFKIFFSG